MKALLIDDERLPRMELRRMLRAYPQIEVVGEAADAVEARELIAKLHPDLLFLDVQMPEETGLELLASLAVAPRVIFVTAHDHHALQAFEFGASDYLLKPVEPERLRRSVERVTASPINPPNRPGKDEESSEDREIVALAAEQKVFVRDGDHCWFVPVSAIQGAEACGSYVKLWLETGEPLIHRSLTFLEQRLPRALFFRANRTVLVNVQAVTKVEPWFSGGLKLTLKGGRTIEVSRRQAKDFRENMSL